MPGDLTFDAPSHTYRVDGRVVPGVTTVLRAIENFDHVDWDVLERARSFGTHVHSATDMWERGELDEEALDPALVPYLNAYKQFLHDTRFVVTHSEERVYHPTFRYAGTLDRRGTWKGTTWLLDLKSGAVPRSVGPQTSAYAMACDVKPRRRLCLQLMANRYRLIACDEVSDWSLYLSCLNIWQFNNRTTSYARSKDEAAHATA